MTLTLNNMGTCRVYFGTDGQDEDDLMTGDNYPAYRGLCYAVFDDVYVGELSNVPTVHFILARQPEYSMIAPTTPKIAFYDYNPALAIYHLLVVKLGLPESYVDLDSFAEVSETMRSERLGLSLAMDMSREARSIITDVLSHIYGLLRFQGDGKFHLFLLRSGASVGELPEITENDITEEPVIERESWLGTINEIKINHPRRVCRITDDEYTGLDGDVGLPCASTTIEYSTAEMAYDGSQTLSAADGDDDYEWSIRTGLGSLDADFGASVVFTAPPQSSGAEEATIDLMCCGIRIDSLTITFGACPESCAIIYSTDIMPVDTSQELSTEDGNSYGWRIASGGGNLSSSSGSSVILTAPEYNNDCSENALIELVCKMGEPDEEVLDSLQVAYNSYELALPAYWTCSCESQLSGAGCTCPNPEHYCHKYTYTRYKCNGEWDTIRTDACCNPTELDCTLYTPEDTNVCRDTPGSGPDDKPCNSTYYPWDMRGAAEYAPLDSGCCPVDLWGM